MVPGAVSVYLRNPRVRIIAASKAYRTVCKNTTSWHITSHLWDEQFTSQRRNGGDGTINTYNNMSIILVY